MQARIPFSRQQSQLLLFVARMMAACSAPSLLAALLIPPGIFLIASDMTAFGSAVLGGALLVALMLGSALVFGAQGASLLRVWQKLSKIVATDEADQAHLLDTFDRLKTYFQTEALFASLLLLLLLFQLASALLGIS